MHKSASLVSNLSVWPHITQCPPLVSSYTVLLGCTGTEAAEGSSVSETQIYFTLYTDGVSNMIPVLEKKRDKTTKIVCLNINIFCQLSRLLDLFIHIDCMSLRAGN